MKNLNKLLAFSLILFMSLSIISCSEDDDDSPADSQPNTPPAQIISSNTMVGDWEMVSLDYAGTSTQNLGGTTITQSFTGIGKDFTYEMTFSDNPKTYIATGGYTVELTSVYAGVSTTQDVPIPNAGSTGTWDLNGNTLTLITAANDTSSTQILSGNTNSFSYDFAGLNGQSLGGQNVSLTSGQVTLNRIP